MLAFSKTFSTLRFLCTFSSWTEVRDSAPAPTVRPVVSLQFSPPSEEWTDCEGVWYSRCCLGGLNHSQNASPLQSVEVEVEVESRNLTPHYLFTISLFNLYHTILLLPTDLVFIYHSKLYTTIINCTDVEKPQYTIFINQYSSYNQYSSTAKQNCLLPS